VKHFKAPKESIGYLEAEAAATMIAMTADVAIVLDDRGVIRDCAFHSEDLARSLAGSQEWIGRFWVDTVAVDSRSKVEEMLADAISGAGARWRQVNHPAGSVADIPIYYSATRIGADRIVAVGRDLRPMAELQQRLVEAQNSMERDYSRFRQVEMRYRLLFELSPDSLAILEAGNLRIVDANPAARQRFETGGRKVVGRSFLDWFDEAGGESVQLLLAGVRAAGRGDNVRAHLANGGPEVLVSASLVRQDNTTLFLVRVASGPEEAPGLSKLKSKLLKVVENAPDAIVVTGPEGQVLTANAAFLELVHLTTDEQARGQPLDRWLGRPGIDLDVLTSNLKRHGSVRLFGTTLRAEFGAPIEVEVSAVSVMNGGRPCHGFAIRNISRRLTAEPGSRELPRSVEQLKELVGRVSLKDLVRETTDLIERRCIEAALELTDDNRASAAEMLGLSRQSLYIKLRRYGLAELSAGES